MLVFCQNIVSAHCTSAFGGKPTLWDFLRDVVQNLNRNKVGYRFSENTKCFLQAMKIFGGRRMCNLFSINFHGPTLSTIERQNAKGIFFLSGEHVHILKSVAAIYKSAMTTHGIQRPVPVILAEGSRFKVDWPGWVMSASFTIVGHVKNLHDQDYIHNGKKLINPLDSPVRLLQLGGDVCCLEHLGFVYNMFSFDEHGLRWEDIDKTNRLNWASTQRLCQTKVRDCLELFRTSTGHHGERTFGTQTYLAICADYFDIFLSLKLSLYDRVVLAAKVSFFFRLWRLWLKHGDHTVGGNTKSLIQSESFVSQQCFLDVQMSCHLVVLLNIPTYQFLYT